MTSTAPVTSDLAITTRGNWVIVERKLGVISIGDRYYGGHSMRRIFDQSGRVLLMPAIRSAATEGRVSDLTNTFEDDQWIVHTEPILAPRSGDIVAALGICYRNGDSIPPKPVIGAWEWEVNPPPADEPNTPPRVTSYWSDTMFSIYDVDAPPRGKGNLSAWTAPKWFGEVIVPEDRARFRVVSDEWVADGSDIFRTMVYSVYTAYGAPNQGRRRLRLAGRGRPHITDAIVLNGITQEVHGDVKDYTPGLAPATTDDFLRGVFDLLKDVAVGIVDTSAWIVYMTSPGWNQVAMASGDGYLPAMICEDEMPALTDYLRKAADNPHAPLNPIRIGWRASDGAIRQTVVSAVGAQSGSEANRYAIIRLTKA